MQEIILALLTLDVLLSIMTIWQLHVLRRAGIQAVCYVDSEIREMPEGKHEREREREPGDLMDEGFENIMRFSVNGHDGFDVMN